MKKNFSKISSYWPLGIIFLFWLSLLLTNYKPNTWLLGWDNLVPELNPLLNLKRAFFSAWQDYQGLGFASGMAWAAELPRQILLLPLSLTLPTRIIRYFWTFFMLLIGPLGAYFLVKKIINSWTKKQNSLTIQLSSLITAIYYLLNLATVQHFSIPLESFTSFYGFFPWLLYSATNYLENKKNSSLFLFFIISFFATSAFQVQTMFVVYVIIIFLLLLDFLLREKLKSLTPGFKLGLMILITNLFWLIPVAYFTATQSEINVLSKQSQISTPEIQLWSKAFGNLSDIALLRGFWFDHIGNNIQSQEYLLLPWRNHLTNPLVLYGAIALFCMSILGIIWALLSRKKFSFFAFLFFLISVIMLSSGNGFLGYPFELIIKIIPLFGQIFRVPFTKWSTAASLIYGLGLGFFVFQFLNISKNKTLRLLSYSNFILIFSFIFLVGLPAFNGNLIHKSMQQKLPQEYLELFKHLDSREKDARIAYLPSYTFWGWNVHNWGYQGGGFIWYGIKQPILHRSFDTFSKYNEGFYHEFLLAINANDHLKLKQVIEKYDIAFILIDHSQGDVSAEDKDKFREQSDDLIKKTGGKKDWENNFISVYETHYASKAGSSLSTPKNYSQVFGDTDYLKYDPIFPNFKSYIQTSDGEKAIHFPFSQLNKEKVDKVEFLDDTVLIKSNNNNNIHQASLIIPPLNENSFYAPIAKIFFAENEILVKFIDSVTLNINSENIALQEIPNFIIPVKEDSAEIIILINDQAIEIKRGEEKNVQLRRLNVGEEIIFQVISIDELEEAGDSMLKVDQNKIISETLDKNIWQNLLSFKKISLSRSDGFQENSVKLLTQPIDLLHHFQSKETLNNCNSIKEGETSKKISGQAVLFQASNNGIACESNTLKELTNKFDYLLKISGENIQGRSLRFFIHNLSNQNNDTFDIFPTQKFQSTYSINSWPKLSENNYTLYFDTKSFKDTTAINRIDEISAYQLPVSQQWLSEIYLVPKNTDLNIKNNVDISSNHAIANFLHFIEINSESEQAIFKLSQAHDPAWLAFARPADEPLFSNSYKLLDHYKYNGWANAWMIDEPGEYEIIIIFWPQLLSFAGYGLLIGTFVGFVIAFSKPQLFPRN